MKKIKLIGEGGIYNGMEQAETNEVEVKKEVRIHISQKNRQVVQLDIIKSGKVIKTIQVVGGKWIKLIGKGKYQVKVTNNKKKNLKVGISIFENC